MGLRAAPAARAALSEATLLWPDRSIASDGIIGDEHHSPLSDHRDPDVDGFAEAFDLTHDPAHGVDCNVLSLWVMADPRVKYIIWNHRIWNPSVSPNWRTYNGTNSHTKHMHVSLTDAARDDIRPWWLRLVKQGTSAGGEIVVALPQVKIYAPIHTVKFFTDPQTGRPHGWAIVASNGATYGFGSADGLFQHEVSVVKAP